MQANSMSCWKRCARPRRQGMKWARGRWWKETQRAHSGATARPRLRTSVRVSRSAQAVQPSLVCLLRGAWSASMKTSVHSPFSPPHMPQIEARRSRNRRWPHAPSFAVVWVTSTRHVPMRATTWSAFQAGRVPRRWKRFFNLETPRPFNHIEILFSHAFHHIASRGDVFITRRRVSLMSSIALRMPSRPRPESFTPP